MQDLNKTTVQAPDSRKSDLNSSHLSDSIKFGLKSRVADETITAYKGEKIKFMVHWRTISAFC